MGIYDLENASQCGTYNFDFSNHIFCSIFTLILKLLLQMQEKFIYDPAIYTDEEVDIAVEEATNHNLIVWNDEVNTFEWVIETLMVICGHQKEQAEQCAMLIHTKGKYAVKQGSYEFLKPQCDAITERQINATVE